METGKSCGAFIKTFRNPGYRNRGLNSLAGLCQLPRTFGQNLCRVGLDKLTEGTGKRETQTRVDFRNFIADRQTCSGFANDRQMAHQLTRNIRQPSPQLAW